MSKKRFFLSLAVNAYLFISTLIISLTNLLTTRPPDSHAMGFRGVENLMYYTVDSNIFMSLCAVVIFFFLLKNRKFCCRPDSVPALPGWLHIVILTAAVSVGVTFATVAFFLSPGQAILGRGYFSLFTGKNLYLHLINPLLGCADFLWLIPLRGSSAETFRAGSSDTQEIIYPKYTITECLYGIIPTVIYTIVYTICVAFTKSWPDIYNFTFGGHYELSPIPIVTIPALAFGISVLLTRLYNRIWKRCVSDKRRNEML